MATTAKRVKDGVGLHQDKARSKPKFSTRKHNRCKFCGRPRGFLRKFGICRLCFRQLALRGEISGSFEVFLVRGWRAQASCKDP